MNGEAKERRGRVPPGFGLDPPGRAMALSSRAHAFSVDVLVGNSAKRKMLDLERDEGSLPEPGAEKGALRKCQAYGK